MRAPRRTLPTVLLVALMTIAIHAVAHEGDHAPANTATPAAAADAPEHIGKPETARWTATTLEAAATEANKKVLAKGKTTTVTGEVVDVSCYMQLGKRGEAHIPCGTKCITNGMPIGLLDAEENLYILFPEEHHPRRDGEVELSTVFVPHLAKTVTVTGVMTEMKGYRALFVQAAEAGGIVGTEAPKAPETATPPKAETPVKAPGK